MKLSLEIRLFFIRHRNLILIIILSIIGIISFVQYLNNLAMEKEAEEKATYVQTEIMNEVVPNKDDDSVEQTKTFLYEEDKENTALIKKFISYCKYEDKEEAYAMLSDACKEEYFQTLDIFYRNYLKAMFYSKYDVEVVYTGDIKDTYNIVFKESMLHTGKTEDLEEIIHYFKVEKNILEPEGKVYINGGGK